MVEEYDLKTHEIVNRKVKNPSTFKESKWEWEIGDGLEKVGEEPILIKSSNAVLMPLFSPFSSEKTHCNITSGGSAICRTQWKHTFWRSTQ